MEVIMKRILGVLTAVTLLLSATPIPAAAADFRSGSDTVIGPDETIEDDLYITGNSIQILGTVRGDVFAAGQTVIVQGNIEGGLTAAGSSIEIRGHVGRGARIAGGTVVVTGQIERDLLVAAGTASILSASRIAGDLAFVAG